MNNIKKICVMMLVVLFCLQTGNNSFRAENNTTSNPINIKLQDLSGINAVESPDKLINGKKLVLADSGCELYYGESFSDFVFKDSTGKVWPSNPAIYSDNQATLSSNDAKAKAYSQLDILYFDSVGKNYAMSTYPDAINGKDLHQVVAQKSEDSLYLTYTFGKKEADMTMFRAISTEKYQEIVDRAAQFAKEKKITLIEKSLLNRCYVEFDLTKADSAEAKTMTERYPGVNKLKKIHLIVNTLTIIEKNKLEKLTIKLGYKKEDILREHKIVGGGEDVSGSPYYIIPIKIKIDQGNLVISVLTTKIEMVKRGYYLNKINVFPQFGGTPATEKGYTFLPDGSGMIINHNSSEKTMTKLSIPFYGTDWGLNIHNKSLMESTSIFPVFGTTDLKNGFLAVVEKLDAVSGVMDELPDSTSPYSRIYPWVYYQPMDTVYLDGRSRTNKLFKFSAKKPTDDFQAKYMFISGNAADYSGMAALYRSYLNEQKVLAKDGKNQLPVNITAIGSVQKKKNSFGIPVTYNHLLTSYDDVLKIYNDLNSIGIENASLRLEGWMNGGIRQSLSSKVNLQKEQGGREGFDRLLATVKAKGYKFYPEVDLFAAYSKGFMSGYKEKRDSIKFMDKSIGTFSMFEPATGERSISGMKGVIINPLSYQWIYESFINSFEQFGYKNISISKAGSFLAANYDENKPVLRNESEEFIKSALSIAAKKGYQIMTESGNQYALPFADNIINVPLSSSGYRIQSRSIPFVSMVLHSYKQYSSPTTLSAKDMQLQKMKCLENASGLQFKVIAKDTSAIKDSDLESDFSIIDAKRLKEIKDYYTEINSFYKMVSDSEMTVHQEIEKGVYRILYANGVELYLNYNETDYTSGSIKISPMNYLVMETGVVKK